MKWAGELVFGSGWAAFRGAAADNSLHSHVAVQLVFGEWGSVTVLDRTGEATTGPCIAVKPLVAHQMKPVEMATLLYVEPQTPIALAVATLIGEANVAVIDSAIFDFAAGQPLAQWAERLETRQARFRLDLDVRLRAALTLLAVESGSASLSEVARRCGLSASRLRVLARQQLGVPLATWQIWRKLEQAAQALNDGSTLAHAAAAGGFADQAHFTRALKRMFGITPQVAQNAPR